MDKFHQNFKPEDFKFDQKLLEQLHQMQAPTFDEKMREELKRQMDQLKRQMEEMQALGFDHLV
jgi:hypothetical protein